MKLSFGDERQTREYACDCCNAPIERAWNVILVDGSPHAVYYANCYHHQDRDHDAWIDVVFGTWGVSPAAWDDHVTFGCRVGPVMGSPAPASTLVTGGLAGPDSPLFGTKLAREEALRHPRLAEFWEVSDFILENDPLVRRHLYGR
ncbi:hypothetical protein [Phaeacidiphilus oryzae]|uniref:hypothetical protein n=1 Tax=Phaeacidiphilus oryzae TaxID=348818 RepID=UPI000690DD03|nr:hypothetical protein [Phaeacidiphilus oryzae]